MDRLLLVVKNFFLGIGKPRTVLFFLALSLLFWSSTKLSKSYTTPVDFEMIFLNLSDQQLLLSSAPQLVKAESTASGFRLTQNILFPPKVEINSASASFDGTRFYLTENKLRRRIQSQISNQIQVRQVLIDTLYLPLGIAAQKKIPVKFTDKLSFANGYDLVEPLRLSPDSIVVSGPKAILDTLKFVTTQSISKSNVDASFTENTKIRFDNPSLKSVSSSVQINAIVDRFTEKTLAVPVQITNLPNDVKIKLFPPTVSIKFKASFSTIKDIEPSDFLITCDYNQIAVYSKLPLTIQDQPNGVSRVILSNAAVDYLLKK